MRYVNLSTILVYRLVSLKVKARFPTYKEMIDSKLILPHEVERLEKADAKTPHESTWTPILWAVKLLQRARTDGKIAIEAPVFANLISSMDYIEECNRKILNYGWINFPLAYTQVATFSVFAYFIAALFGRQYLMPREEGRNMIMFPNLNVTYASETPFNMHTPDFYVPFFSLIEFFCYMGWIKVAETLLNPFGDDDEDFQVNYLIDRNLQVCYLIVDEAEEEMEMLEDPFLEAGITIPEATDLPAYTNKSSKAPLLTMTSRSESLKNDNSPLDTVSVTKSPNSSEPVANKAANYFLKSITLRSISSDSNSDGQAAARPKSRRFSAKERGQDNLTFVEEEEGEKEGDKTRHVTVQQDKPSEDAVAVVVVNNGKEKDKRWKFNTLNDIKRADSAGKS